MVDATLRYDEKELKRLCREHHVRRLDLFGSQAKGTANAESDVDLLVEYEPGHVPGLLGFLRLEEELKALFGVYSVDLVSRGGLSPYLRDEILRTRSPLYEQYHAYLMHIRDSLHDVQTFVRGESYESFLENRMVQNAVIRSFEVVGEAARRTSAELREAHPEVPWRLMSDFRNKLIHDYFGLDLEVIWRTATEDTPVLLQEIEKLMEEA